MDQEIESFSYASLWSFLSRHHERGTLLVSSVVRHDPFADNAFVQVEESIRPPFFFQALYPYLLPLLTEEDIS